MNFEYLNTEEDRFPKPILSEDEKDDITRKALNYEDTTSCIRSSKHFR